MMMGLMAQQVFEAEENSRSMSNERPMLSSATRRAKIEKRQITRNRTSYSCQNCRKRKIKCDKVHPECGACLKSNDACIYGKRDPMGTENGTESSGHDRASGLLRNDSVGTVPSNHVDLPLSQHSFLHNEPDYLSAIEGQLARLASMVEKLRKDGSWSAGNGLQTPISSHSPATSHVNAAYSDFLAPSDTLPNGDAALLDRAMSELEITKQKILATEATPNMFWETISGEIDQLQTLFHGSLATLPATAPEDETFMGGPRSDPIRLVPEDGFPATFGFHQTAHDQRGLHPASSSSIYQDASADKSALLLGRNSPQVRAMQDLDLAVGVPSEAQSNALFRAYATGVYPIVPFTPLNQSLRKYREFWDWKRQYDRHSETVTESPDILFLPSLNCIWYSGVLAMSTKGIKRWFPGRSRADLAAHYHDQVVRYLVFLSFSERVRLPLVSALMTLEFLPSLEQDHLQSSAYLNLIVRLAQKIGVNREGRLDNATPYVTEMQRRMWAHILKLDTLLCISSGMPSSIDDSLSDSLPISEVKDHVIGTEDEKNYQEDIKTGRQKVGAMDDSYGITSSIVSVYQLVSKASSTVDRSLRRILRAHQSLGRMTKGTLAEMNTIIDETESFVKGVMNDIPAKGVPELGFEPEAANAPVYDCDPVLGTPIQDAELSHFLGGETSGHSSNIARYHRQKLSAFHKWARIMLSLLCDKLHIIAYAPFLKNARSKLWTVSRQCALHHASSFLRKFVCLASDPQLEPFRWSWPGLHQPLHAAAIILIDVYERPHSIEAPRSRSWIDKLFALADPAAGVIGGLNGPSTLRPLHDGGNDAWDQLRGLRNSAWRKAGLDPAFLWSEEDQVLVGIAKPLTEKQLIVQSMREDSMVDETLKRSPSKVLTGQKIIDKFIELGYDKVEGLDRAAILEFALSDHADEVFTMMKPPLNRMVNLEGQQRMPYPLSPETTQRCTRHEAAINPASAKNRIDGTMTIMLKDLIDKIISHAEKRSPSTKASVAKKPQNDFQNTTTPLEVNSTVALHIAATTESPIISSIDPFLGLGTVQSMPQLDGSTIAEPQQEIAIAEAGLSSGMDTAMSDSPDSFDWEKWDAVFGQYGGFTDLMEDIRWEEPPSHT